jgi:hypothetical protein
MEASDQDFWRLVAAARNPERLFAVRSNKYCAFYAGHCPDGTQVLIGRTAAEKILVLSFSEWGGVYGIQRRTLPSFRQPPEESHLDVNDVEFHHYLRKEFGFTAGLVRVLQFLVSDDDCGFWVGPLPWHFNQFLAAPEKSTTEEQAEFRETIRQFIARDVSVLAWENDWWVLEADGVEAGWDLPVDSAEQGAADRPRE